MGNLVHCSGQTPSSWCILGGPVAQFFNPLSSIPCRSLIPESSELSFLKHQLHVLPTLDSQQPPGSLHYGSIPYLPGSLRQECRCSCSTQATSAEQGARVLPIVFPLSLGQSVGVSLLDTAASPSPTDGLWPLSHQLFHGLSHMRPWWPVYGACTSPRHGHCP